MHSTTHKAIIVEITLRHCQTEYYDDDDVVKVMSVIRHCFARWLLAQDKNFNDDS